MSDNNKQKQDLQKEAENSPKDQHKDKHKEVPLDEKLLTSLEQGLPECSGMAMGVDRLIMWLCCSDNIKDVICFSKNEL